MSEIRYYVKNIPSGVSEEDIKTHFQKFGNLYNVSLKQNYGFFSVKGTPEKLEKIVAKYNNKSWNGNQIIIEKSEKESFMDRLARERQLQNNDSVLNINNNSPDKSSSSNTHKKRKFDSVGIENGDEFKVKSGIPMFSGTKSKDAIDLNRDTGSDVMASFSEFDAMWSDNNKTDSTKANISSYLKPEGKLSKSKDTSLPLTKTEKKLRDDERRRQSLANKVKEKQQQKSAIQSALSNSGKVISKKIIFNSDEEDSDKEKSAKFNLFDDQEGDEEAVTFSSKDHFDGEEGRKLLQLQNQFNNDDRFKLDERFLGDDENDVKKQNNKTGFEMVRYDPTNASSNTTPDQVNKRLKKDRTENEPVVPIVLKEKFYEVSSDIMQSLQQKSSGFSLLATYGRKDVDSKAEEPSKVDEVKPRKMLKVNPLLEDSSDDEREEQEEVPKRWEPSVNIPFGQRDNFFFSENDPLIKEAFEFMNKKNSEEAKKAYENYDVTRRMLRKIFKDQVIKRSKKTDMFKKKVGGMKKTFNSKPNFQKGKR